MLRPAAGQEWEKLTKYCLCNRSWRPFSSGAIEITPTINVARDPFARRINVDEPTDPPIRGLELPNLIGEFRTAYSAARAKFAALGPAPLNMDDNDESFRDSCCVEDPSLYFAYLLFDRRPFPTPRPVPTRAIPRSSRIFGR
jgi:hypothetical protein